MTEGEPDYQRLLGLEVGYFDLSTRTANCLRAYEITTVGELCQHSADGVLSWENAGRKTLDEIRTVLGRIGLKLLEDPFPVGSLDPQVLGELGINAEELSAQVAALAARTSEREGVSLLTSPREVQRALVTSVKGLPLSLRATNAIRTAGALYVGELAQMTFSDIMDIKNAGRKTAQEIAQLLADLGLCYGMLIPDWSRGSAQELQRALHTEIVDEGRQRGRALLAKHGPEPAVVEDELSRIARALDTPRNAEMLIKLWGWAKQQPRTLDSIGQELGLTRERVRQIEARALKRLAGHDFDTPLLRACISFLRREVPDVSDALAERLRTEGLSSGTFSPASLRVAAEHFKIKWPFATVSFGDTKGLVFKEDQETFRKAPSALRRRTSERGCVNIVALAAELQVSESRIPGLVRILEAGCEVRWIDPEKEWLYAAETPRNRLANLCSKVLSVAPELHLSELRRAVSKSRRLAMCPPQRVLAPFVVAMQLATVEEGRVTAIAGANTPPAPDSIEGQMVRVLDQFGPALDGEVFATRCIDAGINATSFYIYRLISPLIASLGRNIFAKVGVEIPPGTIEGIVSQRRSSPLASDHGWTPDGKLWFGIELIRLIIMSGSLRLSPFVKDLVQGDWTVLLPDRTEFGSVTCREVFVWTFRKAFSLLGAEPGDFAVLEFDLKARTVLVRVGGPGLFEAMQDPESASAEAEADTEALEL